MPDYCMNTCDIKRKIRKLKKIEMKIRFHIVDFSDKKIETLANSSRVHLIWDEFFDLNDSPHKSVKYNIKKLSKMDKDELKNVISEYYYGVYYQYYKENGILPLGLYEPDILAQLGLPFDASQADIKKRFRELAKKYHPDAGGDSAKFIEIMEQFDLFLNK